MACVCRSRQVAAHASVTFNHRPREAALGPRCAECSRQIRFTRWNAKGSVMLRPQNDQQLQTAEADPGFRYDVLCGLSLRPRTIPARWLYDRFGSELFEAITTLPEYYPSRTERSILCDAAGEIAALVGP